MKKKLSIFLSAIMLLTQMVVFSQEVKYNPFDDVPLEHEAYEEISYLYLNDIINGKSAKLFAPEDNIKREELAKVIAASLGTELSTNTGSFSDVVKGSWYEPYVETTKAANIYKGISETEFGVGQYVTKQDCAVLMQRLSEIKIPVVIDETSEILPADFDAAADYAKDAIRALSNRCVIKVEEGESFNPAAYATRAEVCQMLYGVVTQADKMWDYEEYYDYDKTVEDDRLTAQMPVPYDLENFRKYILGTYDFESDDLGDFSVGHCTGSSEVLKKGGIDNSRCLKVEQTASGATQYQLAYKDYNAAPTEWYFMTCRIKLVDVGASGSVRPILQVYDANGKWLKESNRDNAIVLAQSTDEEWIECTSIFEIPREDNTLEKKSEFYTFRLNCYMTGTGVGDIAYFDDISFGKILYDPMDTALVTPNYKGLIYGNDGVSDINMRVWISDYSGGYDTSDFRFESKIIDEEENVYATSSIENVSDVMDVTYSSNLLDIGNDYYLLAELYSKSTGELMQKQEWTLRVREKDYRPYIHFDKYNRLIQDGEIKFPMMEYYGISNDGWSYEQMLEITEGTPITAWSMGETFHLEKYRTLRTQALRKGYKDLGIQGKLGMAGFVYSKMYSGLPSRGAITQQTDIRKLLEVFAERWKDDPLLFCYYCWDEQDAVNYGEELRWQNDILANADIDHPTFGCTDRLIEQRPGIFAKTADILACDPYVCTGNDDQVLGDVYNRVATLMKNTPNKPQSVVLQGFFFKKRIGDSRGPTEQEYRNMTWQAICAGVSMIDNYAIGDAIIDPWDGKTWEEIWKEEMNVYAEVDYMKPVILSREPAPHYELKGNESWLNTMARRYDGKSYIFAVNNENSKKQFRLHLDNVKKIKGMYTDVEYTADENGWFKIDLEGYEVEIFEAEQADYLSPHAELIRFGISNGDNTYIVTDFDKETPIVNIDDNATSVDIFATISDYATVYVNGEKLGTLDNVENVGISGKINIEGLDEITVKVVSQDGRFSSEKTYLISRVNK